MAMTLLVTGVSSSTILSNPAVAHYIPDWPITPIAPDDDPTDTRGHGTHVAGIIAGKTDFWQGVAPEATLYAYKVFSTQPSTSTAVLIDSFIRAYEDGVSSRAPVGRHPLLTLSP